MKQHEEKHADDFTMLLIAAMLDAAVEGKCAQLQTTIAPPGGMAKIVRLIVIPEELDWVRSSPDEKLERPL